MKELFIELKRTARDACIKLLKVLFILLVLIPSKIIRTLTRRLYALACGNPKASMLAVFILSVGFVIASKLNCACKVKDMEKSYDSIMFVNDSLINYSRYETGYNDGYNARHYKKP